MKSLTVTELKVMLELCSTNGPSNDEIAARMKISASTVKAHIRSIMLKINARNRTHAACLWKDRAMIVKPIPHLAIARNDEERAA